MNTDIPLREVLPDEWERMKIPPLGPEYHHSERPYPITVRGNDLGLEIQVLNFNNGGYRVYKTETHFEGMIALAKVGHMPKRAVMGELDI
jgi:hypothetical protein